MLIVNKKWYSRGLIFLVVVMMALLLATTALAQGSGPMSGPMGPPDMEKGGMGMGMPMGSSIAGMVWYDGNGNMEFDPNERNPKRGEHAMDGAVVKLWAVPMMNGPHGGAPSHLVATTVARDGGYYKFENVSPGTYSLEVTPPPSHVINLLSIKNNPTAPFDIMGGENKYISFPFKVYLDFVSYPYLNNPVRLSP